MRSVDEELVEEARSRAARDLEAYRSDTRFQEYVEKMADHLLRESYPLPLLTLL